ncbi:hypothetical protein [Agromyces humi]|uniref:hypothetical protein n=1 Tax=Agromyces humi TaxID=1766800 RepID=UPI00135674A1|nr:hypothetical protein [Agromyces humi]
MSRADLGVWADFLPDEEMDVDADVSDFLAPVVTDDIELPGDTPPVNVDGARRRVGGGGCHPDVTADLRFDPYHRELWTSGSQATWVSAKAARDQQAIGTSRIPKHLDADVKDAASRILAGGRLHAYLDVLAALDQWRVATGEQLAAITGIPHLASGKSSMMRDLFTVGAVDVGVFRNALTPTRMTPRATLYRPGTSTFVEKTLAPELTYAEWLSLTGGHTQKMGGQGHDRHGVLTTELAVRVAEHTTAAAVVGERFSQANMLGYTGLGLPSQDTARYTKSGDMTVIRQDGARIVVELTATVGRALERKIETWVRLLEDRRMDASGLAVIFLTAEKLDGDTSGNVRSTVHRMVKDAVRLSPGVTYDRTGSRIGVADWREWFPTEHVSTDRFENLTVNRPVDGVWQEASFLDPADLPFAPAGTWATDAIDQLTFLRGIPRWLRDGRRPLDLSDVLLRTAGYQDVPVPAMQRPSDRDPRPFGGAHGATGEALPPKRMRG